MAARARRTIKTVTGAGGQGRDIYDRAIDPSRSTLDSARLIAERAEKAQIDFLFTAEYEPAAVSTFLQAASCATG